MELQQIITNWSESQYYIMLQTFEIHSYWGINALSKVVSVTEQILTLNVCSFYSISRSLTESTSQLHQKHAYNL